MVSQTTLHVNEGVPFTSSSNRNNIRLTPNKTNMHSLNANNPFSVYNSDNEELPGLILNNTITIPSRSKITIIFILNCCLTATLVSLCFLLNYFYLREQLLILQKEITFMKEQIVQINNLELSMKEGSYIKTEQKRNEILAGREQNDEINSSRTNNFNQIFTEKHPIVNNDKKADNVTYYNVNNSTFKDLPVAQFIGAERDINLGTISIIGPWVADASVSSESSESIIELSKSSRDFVTVKMSGLYIVYAQIVYITHSPNCYFMFARQPGQQPRHLTSCGTGDDSSNRELKRSQISCSTSTVARLYAGDTVNLAQREINQTLKLREGYSYFGFVRLSS